MPESPASVPLEIPPSYPTIRQKRLLWAGLTAVAAAAILGVAWGAFAGFITLLTWSYPVLLPLGLAVIVALVLDPVVAFMQCLGLKRRAATLTVCLLTVLGVGLFWFFLLQPLCAETGSFFSELPDLIDKGVDKLQNIADGTSPPIPPAPATGTTTTTPAVAPVPAPEAATEHTGSRGRRMILPRPIAKSSVVHDWVKTNLPVAEQSVEKNVAHLAYTIMGPVGQILGFMLGFGFVPIYVYYFLADRDRIAGHWHEYVPMRDSSLRSEVVAAMGEINAVLVKYLRGQIVVAGCNGILTSIGLAIIGIPYSLVLGIMTGVLSIVPFLGIVVSILPALLLGFLYTHGWIKPVLVLLVFAIVQMSESMFISPRVQSHSTGLHPLAIIIGILFWSMLLPGLLGPVVAVPLTCAVVVLLRRYVWDARPKKAVPAEANDLNAAE